MPAGLTDSIEQHGYMPYQWEIALRWWQRQNGVRLG
jgi:hypothetical protein